MNGQWLFVVAGAQPHASQQGMVGIYAADVTTGETGEFFVYPAPSATGALTITQVVLPRVSVVAGNGTPYVFNVVTRAWEAVNTPPTATGPELDATKQAMDDRIQHEIATARALPSRTPGFVPIPTAPPNTLPTETGLSFECMGILPRLFTHTNCWRDVINGDYIGVFAGAATSDATEGWVVVMTATVDDALSSDPIIYKTPTKVGRVEITQASYPYLTLTTDDGIVFVFNLATRAWENTVPTPTPPLTGTQTLTPTAALLIRTYGPRV